MDTKTTDWWYYEPATVLQKLQADSKAGLSEQEANVRKAKFGPNEIPSPPGTSMLELILEQFKDHLVLILLGAAVISFVLALFEDAEDRATAFVEPAVILCILIANATVGVIQETNAESAIEKLRESEARDAQVLRDGFVKSVPSAELVPGDIIVVAVGDKIPADARLVEFQSAALTVDESMLTGESEAAQKFVHALDRAEQSNAVNQDKRNMLFSGTLVVRGKAKAVITGTGGKTEMGLIAEDLSAKKEDKTPLQTKLDNFGELLSKVIGVICIVVWLINIGHFTDPDHGSVVKGAIYYFKIAVALAVAAIPEGLPAVVTTCLALGTRKMAKKNAIVRSLPSVETLGCTTVICSDKTGTLTTNQMSVQRMFIPGSMNGNKLAVRSYAVQGDTFSPIGAISDEKGNVLAAPGTDPNLALVGKICALCNESTLVYRPKQDDYVKTQAPTEAALLVLAEKIGTPELKEHKRKAQLNNCQEKATIAADYWARESIKDATFEFDRNRKSMSVLVRDQANQQVLLCKGAPEKVLARCKFVRMADGSVVSMTQQMRGDLEEVTKQYMAQGLRCLALAYTNKARVSKSDYDKAEMYESFEEEMVFVGCTAMMDPPRAVVKASIAKCRSAGIRVIVITGDNKVTAESICRQIGVFDDNEDVTNKSFEGVEFERMSELQKNNAVKEASLFSRVEPKHKLELVTLLKAQGEVVAMTGDGVNDATALRKADIGIAMGSGTDVAREASSMVLQDDNFATIVMAVEEGRAIYANTKQFIRYLISSNIGEVVCIFLTAAMGMPEALIPVQLLWVNLVTDGLPATALGFNPPDKDVMERKPRGTGEEIVNGWMFFRYLVIGTYVGIATVMGSVWWYMYYSQGPLLSFKQLTNFHECRAGTPLYQNVNCEIFHNPHPSTISLSVLVTVEMFNALNALSENQSLLVVTPLTNVWVLFACALSFLLHFIIVYVPIFAGIFHVSPLGLEEWKAVVFFSFPVLILDEVLKFFSRMIEGKPHTAVKKRE